MNKEKKIRYYRQETYIKNYFFLIDVSGVGDMIALSYVILCKLNININTEDMPNPFKQRIKQYEIKYSPLLEYLLEKEIEI